MFGDRSVVVNDYITKTNPNRWTESFVIVSNIHSLSTLFPKFAQQKPKSFQRERENQERDRYRERNSEREVLKANAEELNKEVEEMEVGGVRTRAMAAAGEKRKLSSVELHHGPIRRQRGAETSTEKSSSPANSKNSGCSSENSDASRCSSNGSSELLNESRRSAPDLKDFEFENSSACPAARGDRFSRETTPTSSLRTESNSSMENAQRKQTTVEKMPTEAEIDKFFSEAEKDQKKRFTEKYNFDVVKGVPMQGRYEWVHVKL